MRIVELQMKHFGKFSDTKVSFHDGINVISGNNEMGKTTMHAFIRGMLFGIEKQRGRASKNDEYRLRQPWENSSYYAGVLRFESGNKLFRLERSFEKGKKSATLICETDGEELSLEDGDLESLMEGLNETAFRNTVFIRQKGSETDEGLAAELRNYMTNVQNAGDGDIDVTQALASLEDKRRRFEGEKKKFLTDITQKYQELQMRMDYVRQEQEQLSQEQKEIEIQLDRTVRRQTQVLEKESKQDRQIRDKSPFLKQRQIFLMLLLGLAVLVVWLLVPSIVVRAAALSAWLLLLAACIWRRRCGEIPGMEAREEEEEMEQEKKKLQETIAQLQWKKERVLEEQREKETIKGNLRENMEELRGEEGKANEQSLEIEALQLAMGTIRNLSEEIYKESARQLNERISEILKEITGGRYTSVFLDADMQVRINTPEKLLSLEQVSRGTMDQIYFALRMAAGEMLCGGEPVPVILDDAFAMYDDERLERTLRWLASGNRQVILFTCHKREKEILES